jgi:hypothetical protein
MTINLDKFRADIHVTMTRIRANLDELERAHFELRRRIEALFAV